MAVSVMNIVSGLPQDLAGGVRQLRSRPVYSLLVILVLALATGANIAIFGVARSVLLNPLSYPESGELLRVTTFLPRINARTVFTPAFVVWRDRSKLLQGVAAYQHWRNGYVTLQRETGVVPVGFVSSNFLHVLSVKPFLGGDFSRADEHAGGAPVALVSHSFWRQELGARQDALGALIVLNGKGYQVRGVLPPTESFRFPGSVQPAILLPLADVANLASAVEHPHPVEVIARLAPGATRDSIRRELDSLIAQAEFPARVGNIFAGMRVEATSLREYLTGSVRLPLLLLIGSASLVMAAACFNISNLQLAQARQRRREVALRIAMGANATRILRQLSVECLLLTIPGGICGMVVAALVLRAVPAFSVLSPPHLRELSLDRGLVLLAIGIITFTALIFGATATVPLLRSQVSLFQEANAKAWGRRSQLAAAVLVTSQVALAFVATTAAGLLIGSFKRVMAVPLGFSSDHVLTARLFQSRGDALSGPFLEQVLEQVSALPGVQAVGATNALPLSGAARQFGIVIDGAAEQTPGMNASVQGVSITTGYFDAMRIPLIAGRKFTRRDREGSEPVIIVNQAFARRFFPAGNPIGRRVRAGTATGSWSTVVGVVGDVRQRGPEGDAPLLFYQPYAQAPTADMALAVYTAGDPAALAGSLRAAVESISKNVTVYDLMSMQQRLQTANAPRTFLVLIMAGFAVLTQLLSVAGVFGLTSSLTSQRTREFGIRAAVGATPGILRRLVLRWSAGVMALGIAGGALMYYFFSRLLNGLLFGVTKSDPIITAISVAFLAAAVLAASAPPAIRAGRLDLVSVLRHE